MPPIYEFYIEDARYAVPTLWFVTAASDNRARDYAKALLRDHTPSAWRSAPLEGPCSRWLSLKTKTARRTKCRSAKRGRSPAPRHGPASVQRPSARRRVSSATGPDWLVNTSDEAWSARWETPEIWWSAVS